MQIVIVGTGQLAAELLSALRVDSASRVISWSKKSALNEKSVIVHAGSGRELKDIHSFCRETRAPLIELATGSKVDMLTSTYPIVLCPNTNILMLKFLSMLEKSGHLFRGCNIKLTESHQAQKTSVPGTAVSMAYAMDLAASDVVSVRDPSTQTATLQIPIEHLDRHAYHQIVIEDTVCNITMETRIYGASPYADGVAKIIAAVRNNALENRVYKINEFVENGWL